MSSYHRPVMALFGLLAMAHSLRAQSARPISVQASYLRVGLFGESLDGVTAANGLEGQVRYTRGRWSVGAGLEYSRHGIDGAPSGDGLHRVGPFVEPRFLIPISNTLATYVSARLSVVQVRAFVPASATNLTAGSASGATVNAGGGILIRLSPRVNLDLGATGGYSSYGSVKYPSGAAGGSLGTGGNLIVRSGFSIGL